MKSLADIQQQLRAGAFEFSRHALKRAVERNISDKEIKQVADKLEIIEDYPDDKYSPSCLVLGFTDTQRALHLQVSRMESDTVRIITLYEPDEAAWIDYRIRRS
ncbi:MAG: DUF4258 domain-containing protein [Thainema sp.]